MKTIILVRHAMAEDLQEAVSDISRSLIKKGIQEAKDAASFIKGRVSASSPSVIFISSPTSRALETAHIFAHKLEYPTAKILIKEMLYTDPSPQSFLTMIGGINEIYDTAILFGHAPSINEWASFLIRGFEFDMPKSGIVALECAISSWQEIKKECGILKYFEYPDNNSKKAREFKKDLSSKLSMHVSEWLSGINPDVSLHCSKSVDKNVEKIIQSFFKDLNGRTYYRNLNGKTSGKPTDQ